MAKRIEYKTGQIINGFEFVRDSNFNGSGKKLVRYGYFICPICKIEHRHKIDSIRNTKLKSCGCVSKNEKHGFAKKDTLRLYKIYLKMVKRCSNKASEKDYYRYYLRGIKVHDKWLKDPGLFIKWSLNNGYKNDFTIDRINNSKGYSPDNCRWTGKQVQAQNRSSVKLNWESVYKIRNSKLSFRELSEIYNVSINTISRVYNNQTWYSDNYIPRKKVKKVRKGYKQQKRIKRDHGHYRKTHFRLYDIFKGVIWRSKNNEAYIKRGIYKEWLRNPIMFYEWSLKNGYKDGLTIDRRDNSKGYSPDNCRWVDIKTQNRNKSNVKLDMQKAKEIRRSNLPIYKIAEKYNVSRVTISNVINNRSWV